jgi:predicted naringenin-chalcone synthase
MSPTERVFLDRLHAAAEVESRHTALPIADCGMLKGAEAVNDRYIDEATALGERALRRALDAAGLSAADLDLLIVTSVTGVAVPSLDARLIPRLGLRPDIRRLPIFGLGCVAGAAALGRLHDYLLGWPGQTAALLAVELCSLNWPTTGITPADMVASGLFGDGAVALIARGGQAGPAGSRSAGHRVAQRGLPGQRRRARLAAERRLLPYRADDRAARRGRAGAGRHRHRFPRGARPDHRRHRQLDLPSGRPEGDRRGAACPEAA